MSLQSELDQFTGTFEYWKWSPLFSRHVMTDGARHLAQAAKAYWLMDLIASYALKPKVRREPFQVWTLKVKPDHKWVVTCDDGNGNILATQRGDYTDFPLAEVKLYCSYDGTRWVILLPNEY